MILHGFHFNYSKAHLQYSAKDARSYSWTHFVTKYPIKRSKSMTFLILAVDRYQDTSSLMHIAYEFIILCKGLSNPHTGYNRNYTFL